MPPVPKRLRRDSGGLAATVVGLACASVAMPMLPAHACGVESPCSLAQGYYLNRVPAGWNGVSPLPVVVFFHGYGASAEEVMADDGLAQAMSDIGALLVAPNGIGKTWSFGAGMPRERDDVEFTKSVLDDVPGVGPVIKKALLSKLGSVAAIRKASDEELLAVPGIRKKHVEALRKALPANAE